MKKICIFGHCLIKTKTEMKQIKNLFREDCENLTENQLLAKSIIMGIGFSFILIPAYYLFIELLILFYNF